MQSTSGSSGRPTISTSSALALENAVSRMNGAVTPDALSPPRTASSRHLAEPGTPTSAAAQLPSAPLLPHSDITQSPPYPPYGPQSPYAPYDSPIGTPAPSATARHPGCVLCGYVASAAAQFGNATPTSPTTPIPLPDPVRAVTPDVERRGGAGPSTQSYVSPVTRRVPPPSPGLQSPSRDVVVAGHRIIYHDPLLTVYPAEGKEALCANGRHLVIILNHHLTSVYSLGPGDIPVLSHILKTATRLLLASEGASASDGDEAQPKWSEKDVVVGFVNGMPRDPRFPYAHLHAQAFLGKFDKKLPGSTMWRRNVVYGSLNWWSIDDLRAEIREESSNNRVKSGYDDRLDTPIDKVPDAGAEVGLPNALDPDIYANGHAKGGSAFGPTRGTAKGKHLSSLGSTDSSNSSSSTASKAKTDDGFISLNV